MLTSNPSGTLISAFPVPVRQNITTSSIDYNYDVSLSAGQIARFELCPLYAITPQSDFTVNEENSLWGDQTGVTFYSQSYHAGTALRINAAGTPGAAAECFMRIYSGVRYGSALPQVCEAKITAYPTIVDVPVMNDFVRIDFLAHGGTMSALNLAVYVMGA